MSPVEGVALWFATLAASDEEFARMSAWLSTAEHTRAARFGRESLRRRYIIGRASLRWALGGTLDSSSSRGPDRARRPRAAEARRHRRHRLQHFAHRRRGADRIAHCVRIGVDIERVDRDVNADGLARKFLTPAEQATLAPLSADERRVRFLRYWTCKEAMSKATGDGLAAPFRELEVDLDAPSLAKGPACRHEPDRWRLRGVGVPASLVATVVAMWTVR